MRLGDNDSFVDIEVQELVAGNMPRAGDVRLRVAVQGAGFRGVHEEVWIRHAAAERFVDDLYAMARSQRDDAVLGGAGSDELTLRFSRPMRTYVVLEGKLKRVGPGSPATISAWITFSVYVDQATLITLAETLAESWLRPARSAGVH